MFRIIAALFFFSHPLLRLRRKACFPPFGRVSGARC